MAERSEFDRFFDKLEAADPQFQEIAALRAQVSALQTEAKHWRDQHANEVKRAKIIKDTGDVPLQRIQAYERMGELQGQVERLQAEVEAGREKERATEKERRYWYDLCGKATIERDQLRAEVERLEEEAVDRLSWQERYYEERLRLKQEATEKGAESMRERAAKEAYYLLMRMGYTFRAIEVKDMLRALPLKENEG